MEERATFMMFTEVASGCVVEVTDKHYRVPLMSDVYGNAWQDLAAGCLEGGL
jgi:hypothetical protein